ncbi:hypothetical protein ABZX95_28305 [Streptomyces sp. NPDC004232]|uniref:hypothetical protein n=1 Tax=Streptomyces sp. NPDC004232 TaxID=3154454 RepID=UPI001DF29BB7|nr:hypothetical protein [Streptomyces sp. tea 10]
MRHTPAEADLQAQLEHALRRETGRAVGWPDWSEAAPGAIPVVLLDGLDELLQAGAQLLDSARQWSYLREIERFQAREAEQGRPLIVLVTSRTVVADRSEIPARSQVLRLEPFGEGEIERWLDIWNSANRSHFERHGLHPLALAPVLQHAELAVQPLLLLMLALYDSVSGDLHRMRYERISRTQLYERLLTEFARRLDDGELYALLSFTPLTDRAQLVQNLGDMLAAWPTGRDRLPTLLATLFKAAEWDPHRSDPGHAPAAVTRTYRNAVYEANLLLVAVLAGRDVHASAFVGSEHLVDNWRRRAMLWKSQLSSESWELLSSALHTTRCWRDAQPDLLIGTRQAGRPTDLPHLRAALPNGAYADEFATLERTWRG